MGLNADLNALMQENIKQIPGETVDILIGGIKEVIDSGIAGRALQPGAAAPAINLPNAKGDRIDVSAMLKHGPVVVSFYRGAWCPYCNLELAALKGRLAEIEALGARLVAITPETPDNSMTAKEKHGLEFEVLSDQGNVVARQFGLVFRVDDATNEALLGFGIDVEASNGNASQELPLPATYVIASDGSVASAFVDADYTKRMEPDDIIATLKGLGG
jgi:peroxiredoxin